MDFNAIYDFLFNSMQGIGLLVLLGMVISVIAAVLLEWKTRRRYKNHEVLEEDAWASFDDDEEVEEAPAVTKTTATTTTKKTNKPAAKPRRVVSKEE